jgi:hypothetical protein
MAAIEEEEEEEEEEEGACANRGPSVRSQTCFGDPKPAPARTIAPCGTSNEKI